MMKLFHILSFLIGLIIGFLIKRVFEDVPYISFSNQLSGYEVLDLILTFSIGIFLPFLFTRFIEDKRQIKGILINEANTMVEAVDRIRQKLDSCYRNGKISKEDKQEINFLFDSADETIFASTKLLRENYTKELDQSCKDIKESYKKYWRVVTDDLMSDKIEVVAKEFYQQQASFYNNFKSKVKNTTIHIQKI